MHATVAERLQDHLEVFAKTMEYLEENDVIMEIADRCNMALGEGKKVLFCGNGGSAADSQHLAAEFIGRFQKERRSLPAISLTTDTSILTAVGNDYGYDEIFVRQVEGLGQKGDVLIGISTSGNSPNIVKAIKKARELGLHTVGFTGRDGGEMAHLCDVSFIVPSDVTARIQEMHILGGHIICELVEHDL